MVLYSKMHISKIKDGMDQRDSAVFGGARSAITLIFRDNHFTLPETKLK